MPSAYEDYLEKSDKGEQAYLPSYITAADTMNVANDNRTFIEAAVDTIDNIPKFAAVSIISGANQLYNIPTDIGNLFGGEFERSDTHDVIASLDSDLAQFYDENKQGADLVGFLLSSVLPGTAGVKILNAGQKSLQAAMGAGKFGTGMGKALGLIAVPGKQTAIAEAVKLAATNSSAVSLTSRAALKAIGAGIHQNALEALAFETATAITLFKSPVLENQDFGDFLANVTFSAGVFGLVGGAVNATKLSYTLKEAADQAAFAARPYTFIAEPLAKSKEAEKAILNLEQLDAIPKVVPEVNPERVAQLTQAAAAKTQKLNLKVQDSLLAMSGKDAAVSNPLYANLKGLSFQDQQAVLLGAEEIGRLKTISKRAADYETLALAAKENPALLEEAAKSSYGTAYIKLWGEDVGKVFAEPPLAIRLADKIATGEVKVDKGFVKVGKAVHKFSLSPNTSTAKSANIDKMWKVHSTNQLDETLARTAWLEQQPHLSRIASEYKPLTVHVDDIPLMEKVFIDLGDDARFSGSVKFVDDSGVVAVGNNLADYIGDRKIAMANKLLRRKSNLTQEEIAAMVNVRNSFLNGEVRITGGGSKYNIDDIFAIQSHMGEYNNKLVEQRLRKVKNGPISMTNVPQYAKITYDTNALKVYNNFDVEAMVVLKEQQKMYQEGVDKAFASVIGPEAQFFDDINSGKVMFGASPSGAGASFISAASANYGSLANWAENTGRMTKQLISRNQNATSDVLKPLLYKISQNQEAAVEWANINRTLRSIPENYGYSEFEKGFKPLKLIKWEREAKAAADAGKEIPPRPILAADIPELIAVNSDDVRNLAKAHIETNGMRTVKMAELRAAQGLKFGRDPEAFYPIPVNPKDYKHFALVTDDSVTGGGKTFTLYATTADELQGMVTKLKQNPQLTIRLKKEAEDYYKRIGQFDYEKTINSDYINVEAHRKGVSAPYLIPTDPTKISSEVLNWHLARESGLVREAVSTKYQTAFAEVRQLGEEITNVSTSKFANMLEYAEEVAKNPYGDYIKTALGLKKESAYPWWTEVNKLADQAVSRAVSRVSSIMESSTSPKAIEESNRILEKAGYKGAHYDEAMELFANTVPDKGALTSLVHKANSLLATVVLRLDTLNAVTNAVSANVLLGSETAAVIRAIERADVRAVGPLAELKNLAHIKVPGTDKSILSPYKLIANSMKRFGNKDLPEHAFFKKQGWTTTISEQYASALDDITFRGTDVAGWSKKLDTLHSKLAAAANTGEKWTGNKLAEEFNRFVAADVMKQLTDVAVKNNIMTAKQQLAYINTFINRTQGNYLAAQRPLLFQGPIGQAIGLFQTYQFNLMQQLLRHVGEGHVKDAMTLLALQGTIHGMNGLPAFNAINTHLIGTASGNTQHRDIYSSVYGTVGKEAGDWLMYGLGSNAIGLLDPDLKVNLYARGDINPRHLTIVPTDPASIPFVQASAKVFGNLFNTASKLANGGDISTTLLQGIEHNGLSRPLAGLAQTLEGLNNPQAASFSTSSRGNVIAANDLLSLMNVARIAGGKPLDEAIALDATYRFKAYALKDSKARQKLGAAIKSTLIAGQNPSREQIEEFAQKWVEQGGRAEEFNKWFVDLYKTANSSQANEIQRSLSSPFAQDMQKIMGGRLLQDFVGED